MSGQSESDATYCSEAETFLAPSKRSAYPIKKIKRLKKLKFRDSVQLRRSQRLSQKAPDIKIRLNWDNFRKTKNIKLSPIKQKLANNWKGFDTVSTPPAHSVDILAGLAETQTASELLPPNQNQQKTKTPILLSSVRQKRKRRLPGCLPDQPKDELEFSRSVHPHIYKKIKLDTYSNASALQKDIVCIDQVKASEREDMVPPLLGNQQDAFLGENIAHINRADQALLDLTNHVHNADASKYKGDLGVQSQFREVKHPNQEFANKTCTKDNGASNHAVEAIKIRNKNYRQKKNTNTYRRRSGAKAKTLPPCENRKEVVTKYVNLADFPEQRRQPAEAPNHSTTNFPVKIHPMKIERYFDNRTQQPSAALAHQVPICESLLPAVYPPHFCNQIKVTESMMLHQEQQNQCAVNKIDPEFYLTPDLSQPCGFGATRFTTSTPSLPDSLREVFDSDDLREILKLEKTVYHFSDQHVNALAVVLNLTVEYLREVFDNILTLSPTTLQKIEVMLNSFPNQPNLDQKVYSNQHNAAARTRPFNHIAEFPEASSSGASSYVECSPNEDKTFRHFPSQRRTQ